MPLDDWAVFQDWFTGQYSDDEGGEEAEDHSVFVGVTGEVCHRYQIREEKVEYQVEYQLSFDENYSFGEFLENHSNFYLTLHGSE